MKWTTSIYIYIYIYIYVLHKDITLWQWYEDLDGDYAFTHKLNRIFLG